MDMDWRKHITSDPNVCHGKPCIRGTRVMVHILLANLAAGESVEATAAAYHVQPDDVRAVLAYASDMLNERIVSLPGAA